jgi:signal transduction histidine kinase
VSAEEPLLAYRLSAIRSGLRATALALLLLVLILGVPGHGSITLRSYILILIMAAAGAAGVALLPWERMLRHGIGMKGMYTWSALDIVLITALVWVTGGGRSDMYLLYALTSIFFGAAYPRAAQVALQAFTVACYLGVLALTGWHVGAGLVVFRCGVLGIVAVLVSFLSNQLLRLVDSLEVERRKAERSAAMLSTVAGSAHTLTLDREEVLEGLVENVVSLGFNAASLCLFDHEAELYVVSHSRGFSADFVARSHPATSGIPGRVRSSGHTEMVTSKDLPPDAGGDGLSPATPFTAMIGSPVWSDGWLVGVLIAARHQGPMNAQEAEAFELLSAQAGLAMENGARFQAVLDAVKRLEELDRMKDDFLATASHELRTPLTVILASIATLNRRWSELDEPVRQELAQSIEGNGRTLSALISSLLEYARLGLEARRLDLRACEMDDIVHGVVQRLSPLFADRPLEVSVESLLSVRCDEALLDRVIENLLANAAKHTPPGTHVRVSAAIERGYVIVTVADDGPGVSVEEAAHLGERFFRAGDLNTRAKGMGLGLAFVREILRMHGTDLEIRTSPGAGCRFSFMLPAGDEARVASPASSPSLEGAFPGGHSR